ncbi:hypothetical protein SAMN06297387_103257 [Streptomyces zhaozhouensis]|uniref:Uncharacterized protein n=1 Tax=Streptomyces zhaozhouensis TaxID=1300267 RepID=A0A286DSI2_9ACTN|nr:hypothetical protein [Streptomyces zhaozhouensis]SOD61605.1 hypothetical protein SAMN06297387_103257 [Streptomyces zhaozhouensis]
MTNLYTVRVLATDPLRRHLRLRVTAINPDVWSDADPLPDDVSFFLCDLEENGAILALLTEGDDGDGDEEAALDPDADEFDDRFVERAERLVTRNSPFTEEAEWRLWEGAGGEIRLPGEMPFHEMPAEDAAKVTFLEGACPGADYDLTVTDSRFAAPFAAGDWWPTPSFPRCPCHSDTADRGAGRPADRTAT